MLLFPLGQQEGWEEQEGAGEEVEGPTGGPGVHRVAVVCQAAGDVLRHVVGGVVQVVTPTRLRATALPVKCSAVHIPLCSTV